MDRTKYLQLCQKCAVDKNKQLLLITTNIIPLDM